MMLSNEKILNDAAELGKISRKPLPVKVSYAIAKNINKIDAELSVYNNQKSKLIDQYGTKDDKGKLICDEKGNIQLKEEVLDSWNKDIKELLAIENDIDIHKFSINLLDNYVMTPVEIMLIDYMIED